MARKSILSAILAIVLVFGMTGTAVFAQEEHKHEPFDVLLGLNWGMGMTPNIGDIFSIGDKVPRGNYALTFDFGLTVDFYVFNWLSFNSGLLLHPDIYVLLKQDIEGVDDFTDVAATPLCLTIPIMAHVNIPKVEWLYTGIGINLNFPIKGMLDAATGVDTKGDFFVGIPIDLGFDFIRPGSGGMRLFFRVTPEVHEHGTAVPIGFVWQIWNWKLHSSKKDRASETGSGSETASTARSDTEAEKPVKETEAETRLVNAKGAVALAEAELAKATAALSALEGR